MRKKVNVWIVVEKKGSTEQQLRERVQLIIKSWQKWGPSIGLKYIELG
jgi:hypothetical protein